MNKREGLAVLALVLILVGLPAVALGYQFALRPALAGVRVIDIVAAAPETGGFRPDSIRVAAGERVRLRFSAPDVTHGIALGPGLGVDPLGRASGRSLGHVDPGQVREVEVTFDRPGRYVYYCNTWCSPNHWRMRGTIEVYDPDRPDALVVDESPDPAQGRGVGDPVWESLQALGVDIDAPHDALAWPEERPSAARGATVIHQLGGQLPLQLVDPAWRQSHSPAEAWAMLVGIGLSEAEAWDAIAYLWLAGAGPAQRTAAATLYAKNCAACHGEHGDGRGPGADALAAQEMGQHKGMHQAGQPVAFADPRTMLGGTAEIYYAKLRRGGMGTGMPGFGPLFTRDETWALVNFLWTFVLDE